MKVASKWLVLALVWTLVAAQRPSIMDRLKDINNGLRRGLNRSRPTATSTPKMTTPTTTATTTTTATSAAATTTTPTTAAATTAAATTAAATTAPSQKDITTNEPIEPQPNFTDEESSRTTQVVHQLTDIYEDQASEIEAVKSDLETTGKQGDLAASDKQETNEPTKYHFYPHNQHLYLLPECATQQVCNAVYSRFNMTQPLCACADRFRGPCSASIGKNDLHTIEVGIHKKRGGGFKSPTLLKTCENTREIRECRRPQDWALLALQNIRSGKSQYLVICHCLRGELDGPMTHDQPVYAQVPGIRVYGMMCNNGRNDRSEGARAKRSNGEMPAFPWHRVAEFSTTLNWQD